MPSVGQELLNVPFAEMVTKLAFGIADSQTKLDQNSAEVAKFMAETKIQLPKIDKPDEMAEFPLIALGFFPGFYQFQESLIEVKMAITMATSKEIKGSASAKGGWGPVAAQVNASYAKKYEYKVEGSSLLRVRIVPVPPPAILQQYMDALIDKMAEPLKTATQPI